MIDEVSGAPTISTPLRFERVGHVAILTLNRPAAGNAIDVAVADAILAAALECDADIDVRCVVLTGVGRMFCAGGDVGAFAAAGDAVPALVKRLTAPLHAGIAKLLRMDKPLVTAINGAAAGAGLGLAIMGDVVLAARSAKFTAAYGGLGLSPDAGLSWMLPRLVGLQQAKRLTLLGERIDAGEAERIGMVSRLVDDDALPSTMMDLAADLTRFSGSAWRRTRDLLLASFDSELEAQMEREGQAIARSAAGADGREGIAAYLEKRQPEFGRN